MTRRRRGLSAEEARLWAGVARSAIPLKGKAFPDAPAEAGAEPNEPQIVGTDALARAALAGGALPLPGPAPRIQRQLTQHPIERPTRRKLGRGRLPIEARIDLHEMTQNTAHQTLAGFLRQAQGMGMRHVLVITGRGGASGFGSRGILRRVVPQWFATPEFRPLVSGFEAAERHHGGEGALYVRVRRRP